MSIRSYLCVTNRGHEHCSTHHQMSLFHHRTFTQLQITHRLHFPSSTAPTQLFTMIMLAPVFHLTITITQSHTHTHTHYLSSGLSPTHRRVLFSQSTLQSVFPVFLVCFPVFWFCSCSWIILLPSPLDLVCRSPTHACLRITLVSCPCHTCLLLPDPACIDHVLQ